VFQNFKFSKLTPFKWKQKGSVEALVFFHDTSFKNLKNIFAWKLLYFDLLYNFNSEFIDKLTTKWTINIQIKTLIDY